VRQLVSESVFSSVHEAKMKEEVNAASEQAVVLLQVTNEKRTDFK
jgi:hypothetical protein